MSARRPIAARANRRGVASWGQWKPTRYSGCVLWLRADMGLTLVPAVVASPNDVSNAAWTKTNSTTPDAQTIRDTNDAGPTTHVVFQPISGLQVNHVATVTIEAKAGTKTWVRVTDSAGALAAYVNLSTGAVGGHTGTVTVTALAAGWWSISVVDTCLNAAFNIGPANGDGAVTYQGDSTGTVLVRDITITQNQVSAWADQSGNGNNLSQGTAAKQPLWVPSDSNFNGQPSLQFDGVDDFLVSGAFDISAGTGWTHILTLIDTQTALAALIDKSTGATVAGIYQNINNAVDGRTELYMKGSTSVAKALRPTADTNKFDTPTVWAAVYDPAQADAAEIVAYSNGTALAMTSIVAGETTGNLGNAALGLFALATGGSPVAGRLAEFVAYSRPLTAAELSQAIRYQGARYGKAVT